MPWDSLIYCPENCINTSYTTVSTSTIRKAPQLSSRKGGWPLLNIPTKAGTCFLKRPHIPHKNVFVPSIFSPYAKRCNHSLTICSVSGSHCTPVWRISLQIPAIAPNYWKIKDPHDSPFLRQQRESPTLKEALRSFMQRDPPGRPTPKGGIHCLPIAQQKGPGSLYHPIHTHANPRDSAISNLPFLFNFYLTARLYPNLLFSEICHFSIWLHF